MRSLALNWAAARPDSRIGLDSHHDETGRFLSGLIDLVAERAGEQHSHCNDEGRVAELQSHIEQVVAQLALACESRPVGFSILIDHAFLSSRIPANHLENGRIQSDSRPTGLQRPRCTRGVHLSCRCPPTRRHGGPGAGPQNDALGWPQRATMSLISQLVSPTPRTSPKRDTLPSTRKPSCGVWPRPLGGGVSVEGQLG